MDSSFSIQCIQLRNLCKSLRESSSQERTQECTTPVFYSWHQGSRRRPCPPSARTTPKCFACSCGRCGPFGLRRLWFGHRPTRKGMRIKKPWRISQQRARSFVAQPTESEEGEHTPASSLVSRRAASSNVSSVSQPPFGKHHLLWSFVVKRRILSPRIGMVLICIEW